MTETLKKQSLSFYLFFIAILFVPLIGFFSYAISYNTSFFVYLSSGLLAIVVLLMPLRYRFQKKQAEVGLLIQNLHEKENLVRAHIDQEEFAIDSIKEKIINFSQLKGLTEKLSMSIYLEDTSKTLSAEVNRLFGDKDTTIILYLFHSKTGELGISSSQKGQMRVNIKSKQGDVFDQWIVKAMQPLLIEDVRSDYRFDVDKIESEDSRQIRSLISVPLMVGHKALGILRIDSPQPKFFATEDLRFLTTIGDLGAVAIENAQLYEQVELLAIKDDLTGLYLRRYLFDRLPEEISRQMRQNNNLSLLMFDIDKFKQYNDKFGHIAGDIVLRTLGSILTNFFNQPGSLVCRYGGEEFAVLLPNCTKKQAAELAEEIRNIIAEQTIILRREKTKVTVSIGVASLPKDARIKDELIYKADNALYEAKNKGRNRVCSAS